MFVSLVASVCVCVCVCVCLSQAGIVSKCLNLQYIVAVKVELEVICTVSNGNIADDLGWPLIIHITLFYIFGIAITSEDRNFKFRTV